MAGSTKLSASRKHSDMSPGTRSQPTEQDPAVVGFLLENAIRDIGIPPCPSILNQINVEMAKDEPDLRHLDHFISSDVALGSGLIAIANSPFFGFKRRVRSVNEALQMLGLAVAARAIAGLILRKLFPMSLSLERFWHASAAVARLGGWLAQNVGTAAKVQAEDAYTFGLFRDCGIPILMKRYPNYPQALHRANQERTLGFTEVEHSLLPVDHAEIGCHLARSWWLPSDICLAIRHHHDGQVLEQHGSAELPPATLGLIATAQVAEHLFQQHTGLSQTHEWQKLGASCLRLLDLAEGELPLLQERSAGVLASED